MSSQNIKEAFKEHLHFFWLNGKSFEYNIGNCTPEYSKMQDSFHNPDNWKRLSKKIQHKKIVRDFKHTVYPVVLRVISHKNENIMGIFEMCSDGSYVVIYDSLSEKALEREEKKMKAKAQTLNLRPIYEKLIFAYCKKADGYDNEEIIVINDKKRGIYEYPWPEITPAEYEKISQDLNGIGLNPTALAEDDYELNPGANPKDVIEGMKGLGFKYSKVLEKELKRIYSKEM